MHADALGAHGAPDRHLATTLGRGLPALELAQVPVRKRWHEQDALDPATLHLRRRSLLVCWFLPLGRLDHGFWLEDLRLDLPR